MHTLTRFQFSISTLLFCCYFVCCGSYLWNENRVFSIIFVIAITSSVASIAAVAARENTIRTAGIYAVAGAMIQIVVVWLGVAYGYLIGKPTPPYDGPLVDLVILPAVLLIFDMPLAFLGGTLIGAVIKLAKILPDNAG